MPATFLKNKFCGRYFSRLLMTEFEWHINCGSLSEAFLINHFHKKLYLRFYISLWYSTTCFCIFRWDTTSICDCFHLSVCHDHISGTLHHLIIIFGKHVCVKWRYFQVVYFIFNPLVPKLWKRDAKYLPLIRSNIYVLVKGEINRNLKKIDFSWK